MNQEEHISIRLLRNIVKKGVPCRLDRCESGAKKYLFVLPNEDSKIDSNGAHCFLYVQGDIIIVGTDGLFDHKTDHVYLSELDEYDKVTSVQIISNDEFNSVKKDYESMVKKIAELKHQTVEEFKQYIKP